jgi:hypothetical protein
MQYALIAYDLQLILALMGGAPRGHGDPVLGFADVDARGVRVADLECFGEHG